MSRSVFIRTCILLAVTTHARAQYIDFFGSFLQPYTTTKPRNDATKRPDSKNRQTNKQKYQDVIFFETDDFLKQRDTARTMNPFNIYPTTTKPRRKPKTTTTRNHATTKPKTVESNNIINDLNNGEIIRTISIQKETNVDNKLPNARRIENYNNGYDSLYNYNIYSQTKTTNDNRQTTESNYYNRKTTEKTDYFGRQTTSFYNNERTTQRNNNRATTRNPLLNRPGVKPATVDDNRPPITNRPVTQRPSSFAGTFRPPVEPRPVNTRPPFETERPISTGVVQPDSGSRASEVSEIEIELGPDEDEMSDAEKRRLYDICEQKCDEYKSQRVRKVVALPLAAGGRGAEVNVSSCAPDNVPLIIGGQLARIETFPHMALLGWKYIQAEGYAWKCGGSLVSAQYVLTAGHCTYHDKDFNVVSGPPGAVQLGSAIYNDRAATIARVALVVRHPKYKLRRSYHDVALLKLDVTLTFSATISPACLGVPPAVGEPVIATGWGKTEFGGDSSIHLRSVSIPIWDMRDCQEIWGTSLRLPTGPMPENQICAGERKGAKDTCQGDSGGPAQVRDGCAWRVVAVTSVGRSCGAPETPALYARVPRAFVARQVYTKLKPGRDGNNQYGNEGNNRNNNIANNNWNTANNNWNAGSNNANNNNANNNWNAGSNNANNNNANSNWNAGSNNANNNNANNNWNAANNNANNNWNTANNNNANNNWNTGNNNNANNNPNTGSNNNANNNRNAGSSNANSNWNTANNNANNNWNTGNSNGAVNNNRGSFSNQNENRGETNTRPVQNNNGQNNNNVATTNSNQYYDSQGSSANNRETINNNANNYELNNRNNNYWSTSSDNNNRYNQNGSNRNDQTTNGYNQNNYNQNSYNNANNGQSGYDNGQSGYNNEQGGYNNGQSGYNNEQSQSDRNTEKPSVINYGTQSFGYSMYPAASRPWWSR